MDIVTKPFPERLVRDIDVVFLGGETATLTLYPEDELTEEDWGVRVQFKTEQRSGMVMLMWRNMCTYATRERTVQEPITEPPTIAPTP